jgi:hypothetical protein
MAIQIPEWRGKPYHMSNPKEAEEYNRKKEEWEREVRRSGIIYFCICIIGLIIFGLSI